MSNDRREFIKKSLLVLGGVASGTAAVKAVKAATSAPATGPMVPAMTADGRIVHLPLHNAVSKPAAEIRAGVPGRKWGHGLRSCRLRWMQGLHKSLQQNARGPRRSRVDPGFQNAGFA